MECALGKEENEFQTISKWMLSSTKKRKAKNSEVVLIQQKGLRCSSKTKNTNPSVQT